MLEYTIPKQLVLHNKILQVIVYISNTQCKTILKSYCPRDLTRFLRCVMISLVSKSLIHLAEERIYNLTTFWDNIFATQNTVTETVEEKAEPSNFWASLGMGVETPVKQSKAKKKSTASAEVYETIDGLVTPNAECTHYWVIGTKTPQDIGVCKNCNGEMWFTNVYKTDFNNDSPRSHYADVVEIREAEKQSSTLQDSANAEEGE